jgi:hypothetical protein
MIGMYFVTSVIYSVIIAARNDYEIKGIGMMHSIFLLFTDLVILTIPEKPAESKSEASWIYDENSQALYLVWVRFVLIFRPTYWLEQQGYVFFFTMIIAAVDTGQAILERTGHFRFMHLDVLRIYHLCPPLKDNV